MTSVASSSGAFRSERLIYRAIEDTSFDKNWYHKQIQCDPEGFAGGDSDLLRPPLKSRSDEKLAGIQKDLLGVMICLPPDPSAAGDDDDDDSDSSSDDDSSTSSEDESSSEPKPTPIGILSLDDDDDEDSYHHHHRVATLGIAIAAPYQKKGYGTEAIRWALDWAFQRANMHVVNLACIEYNEGGRHLYEKVGFVQDGRYRKCHFHNRKWWDVLMFSMLEDEWEALREKEKGAEKTLVVRESGQEQN